MIVEDVPWNVAPIKRLPHLISCLRVTVLNQGLEASSLLKSGQLVHKAKSAEDKVQHLNGNLDSGLQPGAVVR